MIKSNITNSADTISSLNETNKNQSVTLTTSKTKKIKSNESISMTKENMLTSYVSHKMGYSLSNLSKIEESSTNKEVLLVKCNEKSSEPNLAKTSVELTGEMQEEVKNKSQSANKEAEQSAQSDSNEANSNSNLAYANDNDQQQQSSSKVINQFKKNSNRFISESFFHSF